MNQVQSLEIVSGIWQNETTNWDAIVQREESPRAQLIFTSARAISNAKDPLQSHILTKFKIDAFLFTRVCLESNGFSGSEPVLGKNDKLEHYNHWSRFIVKQTHKSLQPKPTFTRFHSALDTRDKSLPDISVPIHGPQSIPYGWEWYEMGFFVHWTPPHSTIILCFDLPEQLQASIQSALTLTVVNVDFTDPYSIFSVLLFKLYSLYDNSVWSMRNHICDWEATRLQEPDYPLLHEIARHALHVSETLTVASQSIQDIQQQQLAFMSVHSQRLNAWNSTGSRFQFQLRIIQGLLSRSESNKARIHNEIALAFHTAAQHDSKIQVRIGEEAKKETSAMKVIAVITVTFLPATFVSAVFSMSFFHFEPAQGGTKELFSVSNHFWIYWVLAAPLSLVVLGLWTFWDGTWSKKYRDVLRSMIDRW